MIDAINIIAIINLSLLALFLGIRKVNTLSNRLFALVIFSAASDFIINYLIYTGTIHHVPFIVFINISFLWGPFLLWYILIMLGFQPRLNFKTSLHFVPQLISWGFWIYAFFQGAGYLNNIFDRRANYDYPLSIVVLQIIVLCQILGYTVYCTYRIYKFRPEADNKVMDAKLMWLKQFIQLVLVLVILCILCVIIFDSAASDYIYTPLLYMVIYLVVVYKSFQSFGVFSDSSHIINIREEVVQEERARRSKYSNSLFKEDQLQEFGEKLISYLEKEEPYINPNLSLTDLAAALNVSQHQLSQAINQMFQKSFSDLINGYRVDKAKALMGDGSTASLTLEGIGLQSGFGSPSAFYRAFKKHTGITPKAYLKNELPS